MFNKIYKTLIVGMSVALLTACSGGAASNGSSNSSQSGTEAASEDSKKEGADSAVLNDGELAPEMVLTDWDGNEYKLSDQKGKKVYVKFWASWCGVCTSTMPEFEELVANHEGFDIITVVSPGNYNEQSKEKFKEWFTQQGYNIPVYFDDSGEVMEAYGVRAFPTAAYIGSDGVLVGILPGAGDNARIQEAFNTIVK
jgi:thioredoxin family protein